MSAIGPGDLVEAVDTYSWRGFGIDRGAIYTVSDVIPYSAILSQCAHGPHCRGFGVRLRERATPRGCWWCSESFRQIGRPAQGLINSINQWIAEGAPLNEGEIA